MDEFYNDEKINIMCKYCSDLFGVSEEKYRSDMYEAQRIEYDFAAVIQWFLDNDYVYNTDIARQIVDLLQTNRNAYIDIYANIDLIVLNNSFYRVLQCKKNKE